MDEVYADFKTFHPIRKKPAKPLETYTGKILTPEDYIDQPINTEDYATVILHFDNGVRGVLTVSQVSSGRKNRLFYEINGSKSSLGWDSERPNELWIGHRTGPNQTLLKDPSLLSPEARAATSYPWRYITRGSPIHSSNSTRKFMITSLLAISPKRPTSRPSPMVIMKCNYVKLLSAAR